MKRCNGILLALWVALMSLPLAAQPERPSLTLVKRIPFKDVINNQGEALKAAAIADRLSIAFRDNPPTVEYGFIKGGKAFTPGWGGWVLDLGAGTWKQELPAGLSNTMISRDGTKIRGVVVPGAGSPSKVETEFGLDTLTGESWNLEYGLLHPDNLTTVDAESVNSIHPDEVGHEHAIGKITISSMAKRSLSVNLEGQHINEIKGFTDDGHFLVLDLCTLLDVRTGVILPESPESTSNKTTLATYYFSNSDFFVFNRDASWVAGKKGANDWSTFVWDRIQKRYLWKDAMVSEPSAFSPNDKFLYCCDTVNEAATGKAVFENLKGTRGIFSPDGRSLVTVDKEAFYIYTLPKDSEPIFGVYQKPEPWSPTTATKPMKKQIKKTTKKP